MAKKLMQGRRGCFYIVALIRRLDGRTPPEIIFNNFNSACTLTQIAYIEGFFLISPYFSIWNICMIKYVNF